MRTCLLVCFTAGFLSAAASLVWSGEPHPAVDRGHLSLAWDAYESNSCDEVLAHLEQISASSDVADQVAWLRADCLYELARYSEAVDALLVPAADKLPERDAFLLDIFWDYAWEATTQGRYAEALEVIQRGREILKDSVPLRAFHAATRYRARLSEAYARLQQGDSVAGMALGTGFSGKGSGWIAAYPWSSRSRWVPQTEVDEWLPAVRERAWTGRQQLWIRVNREALTQAMLSEAAAGGMVAHLDGSALRIGVAPEWIVLDLDEWEYRAALEGLGEEGAAVLAVSYAAETLQMRSELWTWVFEHRGDLQVDREQNQIQLRHGRSGRSFTLEPEQWYELFASEPGDWESFWRDLSRELARPARAFHCFCGRPCVLREVLIPSAQQNLVTVREAPYAVSILALCPLHVRYVTVDLAREWGVHVDDLMRRAEQDSREGPWELGFDRGEVSGVPYLVFEGEGAAGLLRSPELLLGALEAANGYGVRGATVRVHAPTSSSLVVAAIDAPETATARAAEQVLLQQGRYGVGLQRLDFKTTVLLPPRGRGTFRLTPLQ